MPDAGLLTRGLGYERCGADLVVCAHAQPADLTLRFRFADQRFHTAVVVLDGTRPIELSGQPSAVTELVSTAALTAGADANAWLTVIERVIRAEAAASGCRFPDPVDGSPREGLERVIGALRYPLSPPRIKRGARPNGSYRGGLVPCLKHTTPSRRDGSHSANDRRAPSCARSAPR